MPEFREGSRHLRVRPVVFRSILPPFLPTVKPSVQVTAALAIALASGAGGYFLGKSQPAAAVHATASNATRTEMARPGGGRPAVAAVDPEKLRAKLDAEPNPLTRFQIAMREMEGWVARDPEGALAWLKNQQASDRRDEVMRMALGQYSDTDAKGAAEWALKNLSGGELNNAIIAIAENWAEQNGAEGAAWFQARPDSAERDAAMETLFFAWASNEPGPALEYLMANANGENLSSTLRRAALAGWAKTDPLGAVASSLTLSQANNDPDQFANTVANWATVDLPAASDWLITKLPAGPERTAAAQELATIFAHQSPAAGVAWLEKLAPGADRDAAASALVAPWSRVAPAEAAAWAVSQQQAKLPPAVLGEIARSYFMKDPAAFASWKATLPAGEMKDAAADAGAVGDDD